MPVVSVVVESTFAVEVTAFPVVVGAEDVVDAEVDVDAVVV